MLEINPEPIFATRLYKPDRAGTADTAYSLLSLCQGHADMDACLLPPQKNTLAPCCTLHWMHGV